jgi:hypothetical protein
MPSFSRLIRFQATDSDYIYFADLGTETIESPAPGSKIQAYKAFDELSDGKKGVDVPLGKVNCLNARVLLARSLSPR